MSKVGKSDFYKLYGSYLSLFFGFLKIFTYRLVRQQCLHLSLLVIHHAGYEGVQSLMKAHRGSGGEGGKYCDGHTDTNSTK